MTTTSKSHSRRAAGAIREDLLELASRLAAENPLPAELADALAPLTAKMLHRP